jgi:hypothetical protein
MGILDEAIREHLELKRQHGADDSELKQLEDDAFGPPQRPGAAQEAPDAASEAATEFMSQPDLGAQGAGEGEQAEESQKQPAARREPVADVQEAPERVEEKDEVEAEHPAEEEQPAGEHEAVPPPAASHSTEERHAIADQPTEMFDVEKEFDAAPDAAEPSDDELVAEEITEPRLAPAEPLDVLAADEGEGEVEIHAGDEQEEDEDDFFDEQRLSDELDQALEAPLEPESEEVPGPASEEFESEEMEHEEHDEDEDDGHDRDEGEEDEADSEEIERPAAPRNRDEDVLEETPDFLEEAPEDDELWFEQKPPKDFDFDD